MCVHQKQKRNKTKPNSRRKKQQQQQQQYHRQTTTSVMSQMQRQLNLYTFVCKSLYESINEKYGCLVVLRLHSHISAVFILLFNIQQFILFFGCFFFQASTVKMFKCNSQHTLTQTFYMYEVTARFTDHIRYMRIRIRIRIHTSQTVYDLSSEKL